MIIKQDETVIYSDEESEKQDIPDNGELVIDYDDTGY